VKLISVNVGLPIKVTFGNEIVTTGIFKNPIDKRINLKKLNLEGDRQADLTVHGGPDKAVYSYPYEYYEFWQKEFPDISFNWGMFGENLTTEGLFESQVNVGDRFQIGSAQLVATQPRMPCYKLGVKFGRMDIIKKFLKSEKSGIYFKVIKEGEIVINDIIKLIKKDNNNITIKNIVELITKEDKENTILMEKAVKVQDLPQGWKNYFLEKLSYSKK
jgi:MOSC domain-containing protein YiiM